jgi:transcriptional regulator with XRE-family HTH domain
VEEWKRPSEVFAERLRETRNARAMSQTQLAEEMTQQGRPISKAALLRIEKGTRGLTLDEAVALAATLFAAPANLLNPPEGSRLALTDNQAVSGDALRNWLLTGNPILAWPAAPTSEDRATLRVTLEQDLAQYARALIDAGRAGDKAGSQAAIDAITAAIARHNNAVDEIQRREKEEQ